MIEVKEFKGIDILLADWREKPSDAALEGFEKGSTFTMFYDDEVIAIWSMQLMWDKVGQICMLVSDKVKECGQDFNDEAMKAVHIHNAFHNVRKLYCLIDGSNGVNRNWVERNGFKVEYVMKAAGPQHQDMLGYVLQVADVG